MPSSPLKCNSHDAVDPIIRQTYRTLNNVQSCQIAPLNASWVARDRRGAETNLVIFDLRRHTAGYIMRQHILPKSTSPSLCNIFHPTRHDSVCKMKASQCAPPLSAMQDLRHRALPFHLWGISCVSTPSSSTTALMGSTSRRASDRQRCPWPSYPSRPPSCAGPRARAAPFGGC